MTAIAAKLRLPLEATHPKRRRERRFLWWTIAAQYLCVLLILIALDAMFRWIANSHWHWLHRFHWIEQALNKSALCSLGFGLLLSLVNLRFGSNRQRIASAPAAVFLIALFAFICHRIAN